MNKKITLPDLILIFGEDFIPSDIDKKILMKHFEVGANRIIGEKTIDKIKKVLINSIEAARIEQSKERGRVIESPLERYAPKAVSKPEVVQSYSKVDNEEEPIETDKYGLKSISSGIVSQRLNSRKKEMNTTFDTSEEISEKPILDKESENMLPSVEDLTVLSGGTLKRNGNEIIQQKVQREIAIREYQIQDENRSIRWGKERIKDREGTFQEINNPAYIFHSDLWQFEETRNKSLMQRCDILQHVVLDMVANNINVVMLENETEPFFVVEGYGVLHSKETLKDQIRVDELIQLVIISSEAWQIALKKPEAMIRGLGGQDRNKLHTIDMTSVIPLANIRTKIVEYDSKFKVEYEQPASLINKTVRAIENHRKNIVWTCGAQSIPILREAAKRHRTLIDNPTNSLNMVIIGTNQAIHPMKIKYDLSGNFTIQELLPSYCKKHTILSETSMKNIFGSIPAIYDSSTSSTFENEAIKIANAVFKRIGFSALEIIFDPGYISGNPSEMIPISKLDVILPPPTEELQQKLFKKGLDIEQDTVGF
ncbi:MAG: hypothetical protein EAX90_04670 [Candidatus Heimdallarchaeota archaeon]|nr:hypothetical protein [Candidatus Heimdallarchaeota archaeon]